MFLIIFSFQWVSWGEEKIDNSSKLDYLLPTEKRLEEITNRPVWKYFHKETTFDVDTKMKGSEDNNFENMYEKARFSGMINENFECFFEYSGNGATTTCHYDTFIIQNTLSDPYQEHFDYEKDNFELNQNEITTKIMTEILNKINKNIDQKLDVYKILQKITHEKENTVKKTIDIEKENRYGVENYSCIKDEFGLITISGQYNNNKIQKEKVILKITFFDRQEEPIGENKLELKNIKEFEINDS